MQMRKNPSKKKKYKWENYKIVLKNASRQYMNNS